MKIVEVLIEYANYSLDRPFSYVYRGTKKVDVGFRVLLSFNNRELVGYVTKCYETDKSIEDLEKEFGFSIGEVIDVDAICGGYNIMWALASAEKVNKAI